MNRSAEYTVRPRKVARCPGFLFFGVLAVVIAGLALLLANGLLYQVMFVPVIFGGVYAAACLCFEIVEDLSR